MSIFNHCIACLSLCFAYPARRAFSPSLERWIDEAPSGEERVIAAERIADVMNGRSRRLDLSNLGLSDLPPLIDRLINLEYLNLTNNPLKELPIEIGSLRNLQHLYLSKIPLMLVPEWLDEMQERGVQIRGIQIAQSLTHWVQSTPLGEDRIRAAERIIVASNSRSLRLDLSNLNLSELPSVIWRLKYLKYLDLSYNRLTGLLDTIGQLRSLEELILSHNRLTALPEKIRHLQALVALDLSHNRLVTLPSVIEKLERLSELDLSHNELIDLPLTSGSLQNLTTLSLAHNRLATLPPVIATLSHLNELNLSYNRLNQLPDSIGNFPELEELDLSRNQLITLPAAIGQLRNLNSLNLSYNRLYNLPDAIGALQNLSGLYLEHNRLTDLSPTICSLPNLVRLYLARNRLTLLPEEISLLPNLRMLDLSRNELGALPPWVNQLQERGVHIVYGLPREIYEPQFIRLNTLVVQMNKHCPVERAIELSAVQELLATLPQNDQGRFHLFFNRFDEIKDYEKSTTRKRALSRMHAVIQGLLSTPSFVKKVCTLLEEREVACGDEWATTFALIEKAYVLHCELPGAELERVAQFLLASAREMLVEVKILAIVHAKQFLGETIESVLKAKLLLKNILDLPIKTESMLHESLADTYIKNEEILAIGNEVALETSTLEQQIKILVHDPLWRNLIEKEYADELSNRQEIVATCLEVLLDEKISDEAKIQTIILDLVKIDILLKDPTLDELRQAIDEDLTTFMEIKTCLVLGKLLSQSQTSQAKSEAKEREEKDDLEEL